MALTASELAVVSRLLDEALELDAAGQQRWLAALPAEHAALVPVLRAMLARSQSATDDPLDRAPRLPDELPESTPVASGDLVGPYRLMRELGRGGMGMVWLAERADGTLKRRVALKLPALAWAPGLGQRMRRERDILAALEHPNIARLYDAGVDALGRPYLAMEYVDGVSIDAYCRQHRLAVVGRLRLFLQVARAVAHAHARLIVHRDLKPTNILVTRDGTARLLDFGIAKLVGADAAQATQLTALVGSAMTPAYAAPEQLKGEPITVASDIYSLGALLYELLTGQLPHGRKTIELARLDDEPPAASTRVDDMVSARRLRGDLDAILAKALRAAPAGRYATCDAFAEDVQRHLDGSAVLAHAGSAGYRLRKMLRRHWRAAAATAMVLVAVLGGAAVSVYQAQRATRALERERAVRDFVAEVFRANAPGAGGAAGPQTLPASVFLERSAKLVQARFGNQPALQADMYGEVSRAFANMGAHRLAAQYAQRRIEALGATRSGLAEHVRAHVDLATYLLHLGHLDAAESAARGALAMVVADERLQIDARVVVARVLRERADMAAVGRELDAIEALIARHPGEPLIASAWVHGLRARLLHAANRRDEALPRFDAAIAQALAIQGPQSAAAIDIRLDAANSLASTTFAEKAQGYFDAAVTALRALGGDHATRAALEAARFAMRRYTSFAQITPRAALEAVADARVAMGAGGRVLPAEMLAQLEFWEAAIMLTWGNIEASLALTERSLPVLQQSEPSHFDRWHFASHYGRLLSLVGRHDEADRWLQERLRLRVDAGAGGHPFHAFDYVVIARNLAMQSRHAEALALLTSAPHFEPIRGEGSLDPERYNLHVQLARSAALAQGGEFARALETFPRAILSGIPWDARAGFTVLGEVLCALGRSAEGLDALRAALRGLDFNLVYEHDVDVARTRAVAGRCALMHGDRREALVLARRARAAFETQPHAAPYFTEPLRKLEAALGVRAG